MTEKSIRNQFADTMLAVGQEDENLVVLVGDISHFILQPFAKACPGRYYNVGICEPTIISMAAGMAKIGFYPVVHTIAPFIIERGFEQIKLDFCYQKLAGNLVTVGSVFDYSNLGCTHHCYCDFALLRTLPDTQIIYPSSVIEFDTLFRQAYDNEYLTLYRIPSSSNKYIFSSEDIKVGRGITVTKGSDVTIIIAGPHLDNALEARNHLTNEANIEIIYLHTIRPLDIEMIRLSVKKTRRVLVVEEHMQSGGIGEAIRNITSDIDGLRYASLSIPDEFIRSYGTYKYHCNKLELSLDGIINKIRNELLR